MEIINPKATLTTNTQVSDALRVPTLAGTRVAVIDDSKPKFDVFVGALLDEMVQRYGAVPGVTFAKPAAGNYSPEEWYEAIVEEQGAAIVGWGDCGGCSTYSFLDAAELVRRGIPSIAIISEAFTSLVSSLARSEGMEHVPVLVLPHPPTDLTDEELTALARDRAPEAARLLGIEIDELTGAERTLVATQA